MRTKSETWRKRQAIQIAAQLPENAADARAVLLYATELLNGFLTETDQPAAPVVPFSPSSAAASVRACSSSK